jgi:hypothetical protein
LQTSERGNEDNAPAAAAPHCGQYRSDRDGRPLEIGPYLPEDLLDRFHLAAGTMARVHTGVHEQKVDGILGVKGVHPLPERDPVGDVDQAGYAVRSCTGTERGDFFEPLPVPGNEAEYVPRLSIFGGKRRAQAGAGACDHNCARFGLHGLADCFWQASVTRGVRVSSRDSGRPGGGLYAMSARGYTRLRKMLCDLEKSGSRPTGPAAL